MKCTPSSLEKLVRRRLDQLGLTLRRTPLVSADRAAFGVWIVKAPSTGELVHFANTLQEVASHFRVVVEAKP